FFIARGFSLADELNGRIGFCLIFLFEGSKHSKKQFGFVWLGRSRRGQSECILNAARGRRTTLLDYALREFAGGFEVSDVVHQVQSLKRRVGPAGPHDTSFAIGG